MAIDFDALKARLQSLDRQGSDGSERTSIFWKPTGTHQIRIVPYKFDQENPFQEMYFYYGLAQSPVVSPISFGMSDPILDFSKKLQGTGNTEDWKMGKKIEPRRRTYCAILVRGQEHEGVKFWGFSDTVYKTLLSLMFNPEYGDITHEVNGVDLTVTLQQDKDQKFPSTLVMPSRNSSPISRDQAVINSLNNMPNLQDIYKAPSYDEMKQILVDYLKPKENETEAPTPETGVKAVSVTPPPAAPTNVAEAVDAFSKLFDAQKQAV